MHEIPEDEDKKTSWLWRVPSFIIAGIAMWGALLGGFERVLSLYEAVEKAQWTLAQQARDLDDLKGRVHVLENTSGPTRR